MTWHLTVDHDTYEEAVSSFRWEIPDGYNAAEDLVRKHDDPEEHVALFQAYPDGRRQTYTFDDIDTRSNQLAHGLESLGVGRGDRVAVVVPQKPATPLTHLACWKLGAISLPLSVLYGADALEYRLKNSGAAVAVVDESIRDTMAAVRAECPELEHVIEVDGGETADFPLFETLVEGNPETYDIADTDAETPAIILYTSGSTGPPKGVLHTHGLWLGHLPGFYTYFEQDMDGSVCWTPADWAWLGGLGNLLFPAWHYGRPVVGYPMGEFDPERAFGLMEEFGVTDAWIPPTAIRLMMDVDAPAMAYDLDLDVIAAGGEPLTPEILEWANREFEDVVINEQYGQTEANLLVANCHNWFEAKAGSMGKPVPGHDVAIVDSETGDEQPRGELGELAVRHDENPVIFEEYWDEPEKTEAARVGDWHLTGDLAVQDENGYVWFKSRNDDLIITSGYRVGPGEVESAILEHPDVVQAGVIGYPDETRGEIIKAFVEPVSEADTTDQLRTEIRDMVREQLAKHEYPREIEFVDELPQTTTGKIKRNELRESAPPS